MTVHQFAISCTECFKPTHCWDLLFKKRKFPSKILLFIDIAPSQSRTLMERHNEVTVEEGIDDVVETARELESEVDIEDETELL